MVVPIGLYYERKARFRSSALAAVGEALSLSALLPEYERDPRATVEALTDEIRARLDAVVLQAETRELLEGLSRVARWTVPAEGGAAAAPPAPAGAGGAGVGVGIDMGAQHRRARELLEAYQRLRARDPARVEAIAAEARGYAQALRRLGVRNPWALEIEVISPAAVAIAVVKLAVALPLALAGALMGFLPYRLAGRVARKVTSDEDVLSTVKLLAGALFLFVTWTAEAVAAGLWLRPAAAPAVFALGVASGYVALRFDEVVTDTLEAIRYLWMRAFHRDTTRRLAERRRALAEAVARALREAA